MKYIPKEHSYKIDEETIMTKSDVQLIIEPLWFSVSIYDGEQVYNRDLEKFSLPQRYVLALQWYFAEVYNGGHDQFFFNSTGIVWRDAMEGARIIGLDEVYNVLHRISEFAGDIPLDREKRQDAFDSYNNGENDELYELFGELDGVIYDIDESYIEKTMIDYIRKNKEAFYFEGTVTW